MGILKWGKHRQTGRSWRITMGWEQTCQKQLLVEFLQVWTRNGPYLMLCSQMWHRTSDVQFLGTVCYQKVCFPWGEDVWLSGSVLLWIFLQYPSHRVARRKWCISSFKVTEGAAWPLIHKSHPVFRQCCFLVAYTHVPVATCRTEKGPALTGMPYQQQNGQWRNRKNVPCIFPYQHLHMFTVVLLKSHFGQCTHVHMCICMYRYPKCGEGKGEWGSRCLISNTDIKIH